MAGIKLLTKGAKAIEKVLAKGEGKVAKKSAQYGLPKSEKAAPKGDRLPMPAVQTKGDEALVKKIMDYAAEHPASYPTKATEPVFRPADTELTKQLVQQTSVRDRLPPYPDPDKPFPAKDRARPIHENREAIARNLAERISGIPRPFYSTGTILEGLMDKGGLRSFEARDFMRDWAGQGAAFSPQTKTPPNIRNASYAMFRDAQGNPITKENWAQEGNAPGYGFMGMHANLSDQFRQGTNDFWTNPKPSTFQEAWSGNMSDVVADQHNIIAVLDALDQLYPGSVPKGWFMGTQKAGFPGYDRYVAEGGFPKEGAIPDKMLDPGLSGASVGGKYAQTEYPIIAGPTYDAAQMLGLSPSEMQERMWFDFGGRTGLRSPDMTIPDLFNAQFETTAGATGLMPEQIMRLFGQRRIPLAEADVSDVPGYSTTA
jgi:hypothetical protein